ncbi:MAG: hypothetical protein EOO20_10235 [Chryseobacterium sp.]|nr:MAG: hypothetical protein EOO20_10235 [Chryseobacterium sp.]
MNRNFIHIQLLFFCIISIFPACSYEAGNVKQSGPAYSFLPMQIGNTWKMGEQNYTKIKDTLRIGNELYYEFYSLVGGDASDIKYLRIDSANNLLEGYPNHPAMVYVHAKFDAKFDDVFFTLGDGSINDYKVRVTEKSADRMTFEFEIVNHPTLRGKAHTVSYVKGMGIDENWKWVTIGSKVIRAE